MIHTSYVKQRHSNTGLSAFQLFFAEKELCFSVRYYLTFTLHFTETVPDVAVMVAVPFFFALSFPEELTVTMLLLEDL